MSSNISYATSSSGGGGCIGDIGTHAFNLIRFITELELDELSADIHTFVKGRKLDDNAQIMLRFKGGAKGAIWSSQVAVGNENNLKIRVYGEHGGLEWKQEDPNYLYFTKFGKPTEKITRGSGSANKEASLFALPLPLVIFSVGFPNFVKYK